MEADGDQAVFAGLLFVKNVWKHAPFSFSSLFFLRRYDVVPHLKYV